MISGAYYDPKKYQPKYVSHRSSFSGTFTKYKDEQRHQKAVRKYSILFACFLGLATWAVFSNGPEPLEDTTQQSLYCEMVALHKQDKTVGWPDYKGVYAEVCETQHPI